MSFSLTFGLLFTYLAAPLALYAASLRFCHYPAHDWRLFGICFGITPALISRCLTGLLYAYDGGRDWSYIAAVVLTFCLLAVYGRKQISTLGSLAADLGTWRSRRIIFSLLGFVIAVCAGATMFTPGAEQLL